MEGGKKTRGRQKIEIKRIVDDDARLVSFSKRKAGIMKKANELSNLCGADVGLIIFSPAGKPFAYGHPSIEKISNRFLKEKVAPVNEQDEILNPILEAHRKLRFQNLNNRHNELLMEVAAAKEKNKSLKKITEVVNRGNAANNVMPEWWEEAIDDHPSPPQLDSLATKMDRFHAILCNYMENGASSSSGVQAAASGDQVDHINPPN